MTDEAVSRRRENAAFFLRILAFGLIFTLISCAVLYVLTPKYDYGPGSMMNLPLQPRNTIDVLAVGTSTTYAAVNTNVLWANWASACMILRARNSSIGIPTTTWSRR